MIEISFENLDQEDLSNFENEVSNWSTTGKILYNSKSSPSAEYIKSLLKAELFFFTREYNSKRIYSRFNKTRKEEEWLNLQEHVKDLPTATSDQEEVESIGKTYRYLYAISPGRTKTGELLRLVVEQQKSKRILAMLYKRYARLRREDDIKCLEQYIAKSTSKEGLQKK